MNARARLVVIGNGMAGARFVEDLIARGGRDRFAITVFGDEPAGNYNRILLSGVLAGSHLPRNIFINPLPWYADNGVTLHAGARVRAIDIADKQASSANGLVEPYDVLVIATGSGGFVPPMDGLKTEAGTFKDGVFVFRTLDDCQRILKRGETSRTAVVIGGGLLGLEAARGLLNRGLDVHVLHLMPHVMDAQLDATAGGMLRRELAHMGVHLHLGTTATAILGDSQVTGVLLRDGSVLGCELVVVAAGIRPNVDLAVRAGLDVERGIVVGDDLACRVRGDAQSGVYAIGECAQHRGVVYGLVAPVWEQAQVLADRLSGRTPEARYRGTSTSTKLKVAGIQLAVMGDKDPVEEKDGLDIVQELPQLAHGGWEAIEDGDRERLKWAGVFFRRQTPGHFMMRVRMPNGLTNAVQIRTIAAISREFEPGFADITTRQQIQLRGFGIEHAPDIWRRLEAVGLVSIQTGMDNIRNIAGCPLAGLTPHELLDTSPVVREFTDMFMHNKAFTNLPRKFNVAITGCTEHCTHAESQDLALIPAIARLDG